MAFQDPGVTIATRVTRPFRAPFHPTAFFDGIQLEPLCPAIDDATVDYKTSGASVPATATVAIDPYGGGAAGEDCDFVVAVDGGKTYFFTSAMSETGKALTGGGVNALQWFVTEAEVAVTDANKGSAVYTYHTTNVGGFVITEQGGAVVTVEATANELVDFKTTAFPKTVSGIKNPVNNLAMASSLQGDHRSYADHDLYQLSLIHI